MQHEIKYLRWEVDNIKTQLNISLFCDVELNYCIVAVTTDVRACSMLVLRFGETLENTMKEWLATLGMKFIKYFMQLRQRVKKVKGEKRYRQAYKYANLISVFFINK
jgi:hypothetical protein